MNLAIIGCGRVAMHHCNAILKVNKLKLVSVCDFNEERGKILADKYKVKFFTNYNEMLEKLGDTIDIVAIITPSGMHYDHAMDIINKFKKHIIVEKPTFMKPSQVKKAYSLAKKYKLEIFPIFQNRYNLAVKRVKKAIKKMKLEKLISLM